MALSAAKIIELSHLAPGEVASVVITAALVVALVAIVIVALVISKQKSIHESGKHSERDSSLLRDINIRTKSGNMSSFEIER